MSEMIERVARALAAANGYDPDNVPNNPLEPDDKPDWHKYKYDAAIAIGAMREPTLGMTDAGYMASDEHHTMSAAWQAMIDAALAE